MKFSKLSVDEKIDFIDELEILNLENSNVDEIKRICFNSNSIYLKVALIDKMSELNVFGKDVLDFCTNELLSKSHYLIKLSSIDYLNFNYYYDRTEVPVDIINEIVESRNFNLVKVSALVYLIQIDFRNNHLYIEAIYRLITKSTDYRLFIRLLNLLCNLDLWHRLTDSDRRNLIKRIKSRKSVVNPSLKRMLLELGGI